MTFLADTVFLEFIPEAEWLKSKEDKEYQPTTVLLNEVEEGKIYEIVVTDFYGMPFLRYRLGDLIKIVALRDDETGINLPQMVFQARADDIIDIAGFTRLDEKTVWQAIVNTGIRYEDWAMRKEYEQDKPVLYLYIELKKNMEAKEVERLIHEQLKAINRDYKDLVSMLETKPLRVKLLSKGTFQRYLEEKQRAGVDLAHLKPPHMNASDTLIGELVLLSAKEQV
jgi:phenylacetate-coenzyme A ligase PaaK-like adenylate-forming protein